MRLYEIDAELDALLSNVDEETGGYDFLIPHPDKARMGSLRYGDFTVQCVEIIGVDGKVRTVDFAKTLKESTDNDSMDVNIYDPLDKNVTFGVPDLKVGEIRHVRFCRRLIKPRIQGEWADLELFEDMRPIIKTVVTVDSPSGKPLAHAALRNPLPDHGVTCAEPEELGGGRKLLRSSFTESTRSCVSPGSTKFVMSKVKETVPPKCVPALFPSMKSSQAESTAPKCSRMRFPAQVAGLSILRW